MGAFDRDLVYGKRTGRGHETGNTSLTTEFTFDRNTIAVELLPSVGFEAIIRREQPSFSDEKQGKRLAVTEDIID
jgi:hypothetical protein